MTLHVDSQAAIMDAGQAATHDPRGAAAVKA